MAKEKPKRDDVALLSERLHEALMAGQRKARAPSGQAKCPKCGAIIVPTKNGRIRKHQSDPFEKVVCEASGKAWKAYGKRAPRPKP